MATRTIPITSITSSSSGSGSSNDPLPQYSVYILSDSITVSGSGIYTLTPEDSLADNLSTINGGSIGDEIILQVLSGEPSITIKHAIDNIYIKFDFSLDSQYDNIRLVKQATDVWVGGGLNSNG